MLKPGPRVRGALRRAADLIFAPQTYDGGPRPLASGLSAEAWSRIVFLEAPVCDGCGAPFEFSPGPGVRCAPCEARPHVFDRARAACRYDEHVRELILPFKHGDRTDLARLFARWIGRAAADLLAEADAVTPVPLHPLRLLARRYNQAAEIARPLARSAGLEYLPDVLVRRRATGTQGGKSGAGRRRNVRGAFAAPADRARRIKGRRILLVDDVLTTGATADACARALLNAGARAVDVAVIARAPSGRDLTI